MSGSSYQAGLNTGLAQGQGSAHWDRIVQQRFSGNGNAVEKLDGWIAYARQLEARLEESKAALQTSRNETLAARIQRNAYSKHIDRVTAALRKADPQHGLTNDVAVNAELRKEVDAELAHHGLRLDRTNPNAHVVRKI